MKRFKDGARLFLREENWTRSDNIFHFNFRFSFDKAGRGRGRGAGEGGKDLVILGFFIVTVFFLRDRT